MSYTDLFANFQRLIVVAAIISLGACDDAPTVAEDSADQLSGLNPDFLVTTAELRQAVDGNEPTVCTNLGS